MKTFDLDELLASLPEDTRWRRVRYYWTHPRRLRELRRAIKWRIQRARRGYSDCDVWNFDGYLSKVISGGVRQLITELHGWPGPPMTFDEWKAILGKIADGFEAHAILHEECVSLADPRCAELERKREEGFRLFIEWFGGLWD